MSEEAEVADAYETWGQHVEQKASQELVHVWLAQGAALRFEK